MKRVKLTELNTLSKVLSQFNESEKQELLNCISNDVEKSYTLLQQKDWEITTNKGNTIYGLHRVK